MANVKISALSAASAVLSTTLFEAEQSGGASEKATGAQIAAYLVSAGFARMHTGSYTGNGSTSQAITGVGFQPKMVLIIAQSANGVANSWFLTTNTIIDNDAAGMSASVSEGGGIRNYNNTIIALGSDGFTVDDGGSDLNPNTNSAGYDFICFG